MNQLLIKFITQIKIYLTLMLLFQCSNEMQRTKNNRNANLKQFE